MNGDSSNLERGAPNRLENPRFYRIEEVKRRKTLHTT
jgi:hypothetical protein